MLILPHYRAHNQPAEHRMSMYISSEHGEIKTKLVSIVLQISDENGADALCSSAANVPVHHSSCPYTLRATPQ